MKASSFNNGGALFIQRHFAHLNDSPLTAFAAYHLHI